MSEIVIESMQNLIDLMIVRPIGAVISVSVSMPIMLAVKSEEPPPRNKKDSAAARESMLVTLAFSMA